MNTPLSPSGTFNAYNDAGEVDIIADVNGYYAHHDHDDRYSELDHLHDDRYSELGHMHDDRYVAKQTRLIIDGLAFRPQDPPSQWTFDDVWAHSASASSECLAADVDLPIGVTLTDAELHYQATSSVAFSIVVTQRGSGAEATTGPAPSNFVQFLHDLPAVPVGEFGVQPLGTNTRIGPTLLGYSQSVFICTDANLNIGSVRLTYTNP